MRTMTNAIQETLRRFETRLMTIEDHLGAGDSQQARSRSREVTLSLLPARDSAAFWNVMIQFKCNWLAHEV